jgi:hypothetical protein
MAKKVNELQLAQATWGQSEVTDRQPARESAALSLMPARLPKMRIFRSKKRLTITLDAETLAQIEQPVKIRHIG